MPRRPASTSKPRSSAKTASASTIVSSPKTNTPADVQSLTTASTASAKSPKFQLPRYIAVEGPIRVGKSSLARVLAERMHAKRILDCEEENPFLTDFYAGRQGAAFAAQMYFLNERYTRLRESVSAQRLTPVVSDFLFEKDKVFAYLNLDNEELKLYERYFNQFAAEIQPPELVIYLQATPEVLRQRVAKKGAANESRIAQEYIEEVVRAYDHFFFHYSSSNLLVVNTSEIDFVNRNADL